MKISYLGWASFLVETASGTTLLTDPYFGGDQWVESIPEAREVLTRTAAIEIIAVSHADFDHLGEAIALTKRYGSLLVSGVDTRITAYRAGVPSDRLVLMSQGVAFEHKGMRIKGVDARHLSFHKLDDGRFITGTPLGFMVTDAGTDLTVYFAGDTAIFGDLALYGKLYKPVLAMLGIGGVRSEGRIIAELPPHEAAIAAAMLGVKQAVPMHYLRDTNAVEEFARALASEAPHCQLVALAPGESMIVIG